jgi:hypothetical protein
MRTLSCLASEAGTTCSSAPTATRAPSRINLRQWKSWFGLTPYLDGRDDLDGTHAKTILSGSHTTSRTPIT